MQHIVVTHNMLHYFIVLFCSINVSVIGYFQPEKVPQRWLCGSLLLLELSWAYQNASNFHCGSPQRQVFEISEWIRLHIHEPQTVSRIAMEFNYHPNYLSTLFKRVTGDTLLHYINRQKVSYSEELLLNTVLPIKQIALSSGFEDEKHFMKLFKQYKGVTPSQYRNSFCQVHLNHK